VFIVPAVVLFRGSGQTAFFAPLRCAKQRVSPFALGRQRFSLRCATRKNVSVPSPFVVAAIVSVAVSLPVAPGFIGQFHFAFVVGIDLIDRIDHSVAGGRNLSHGRRSLAALEMTGRGTSVLSWGWCQAVAPIRTHAGSAFPLGTVGTRDLSHGRRSLATLEMTAWPEAGT